MNDGKGLFLFLWTGIEGEDLTVFGDGSQPVLFVLL